MSQQWEPTPGKRSEARVFTGELRPLAQEDVEFFSSRYEIPVAAARHGIRLAGSGRYALPIFGPTGLTRGYVLRQPWAGSPQSGPGWLPKADTYKHTLEPLQSHYWCYGDKDRRPRGDALVLVEDQLSAIKLAAHGYDSVALLGKPASYAKGSHSYSGHDRVMEISRRAKDGPVIVALDADATEDAFAFVKQWKYAFHSIRVAILSEDLKDTPAEQFAEVLGV